MELVTNGACGREQVEPPTEVELWFEELRRLVLEAAHRFDAGEYRPALASLVAMPPVHRMLMDGCGEMLDGPAAEECAAELPAGLYL